MKRHQVCSGVPMGRSIYSRLTAFVLISSLVPLMFISALLLRSMEKMTERELVQSYQWLVNEHISNAEEKLSQYTAGLSHLSQNTMVLDVLSRTEGNPYALGGMVSGEMFKVVPMENHSDVYNCVIYSCGGAEVYGRRVSTLTPLEEQRWRKQGWNGGEDCFFDQTAGGEPLLTLIKPMIWVDVRAMDSRRVGLIRMDLYLNGLFAPYKGSTSKYRVALFDEENRCRYQSQPGLENVRLTAQTGKENFSVLKGEIPQYNFSLYYMFDKNEMAVQKSALKKMVYPSALCLMAVILVASYWFFRKFSQRVNALIEKFRRAGAGDLSPTPPLGGGDEIALLDERFGKMLREMDELNRKNDAQQLAIREAKYYNLQLQINPHFLYNTLETISAIGAMHQAFQVCDLCDKLGQLFRYSLGKNQGKYAVVEDELRQTQNYIFIQKVRYQFEAFYSIEVNAKEVCMLRFLLQPIVENAVLHGLAKKDGPGTLEVHVGRNGDDLEIRISDDGVGMTEEELSQLRKQLQDDSDPREKGSSIGIRNISQRIRLSHGAPYGVEVQSRQGKGSTFTLRLPWITKGMIDNEKV